MGNIEILSGSKFGKLQVLNQITKLNNVAYSECICDCGKTITILSSKILKGVFRSCGCIHKSRLLKRHGFTDDPTWRVWCGMIDRCTKSYRREYKYYGGRGITVCDRWRESFLNFLSDMGERPSLKHTIDRIDNDSEYSPGNCRWTTMYEQVQNRAVTRKILFNGQIKPLKVWCKELSLHFTSIDYRIRNGWDIDRALSTPVRKHNKK